MRQISKAKQFKSVERKYFKQPVEPNMLTWSEKEQIKFLHQSDPEKWTSETLAESFPASPDIIKKILKVRWKPTNIERLKAHDTTVSQNWIAFHKGQLEVHDPRLRGHLAKFTDRKNGVKIISNEEAAKITEVIVPRPKRTEFVSLITGFKSEQNSAEAETKLLEQNPPSAVKEPTRDALEVINKSNTYYTLDQFRKRVEELSNDSAIPEDMKSIMGSRKTQVVDNKISSFSDDYVAPSERFKAHAVVLQKSKRSPLTLVDPHNLPDRITIPRNKRKPGLVFRVNDCFYSDKGYFLYRVPGLKTE